MEDYTAGKPWKIAKQQRILRAAYRLFSERGITSVTIPEVAAASGVGRATVFRYFPSKLDLVVAIGAWKWQEYIDARNASLSRRTLERMTAAQWLRFYLDAFIDLYRRRPEILRFNYDFNSYLRFEGETEEKNQPYLQVVDRLGGMFHELYERGLQDGTLNADIPEESMFSSSFHIMLAAATRYAVGLVHVPEKITDPGKELEMLEELLLEKFTRAE